ncbi:MAG: NAD-dependent epimerase [Chitinophagales bacterium]
MRILVTGTAGFIGFHLIKELLNRGDEVVGLDSINDYYDVNLKYDRLEDTGISRDAIQYNHLVQSSKYPNYRFIQLQLEDKDNVSQLFEEQKFDKVCHLAAQAGVRYSLENPHAYINSNIVGFVNIIEGCRHTKVKHLAYASSSSVYGLNEKMPFSTSDNIDHPISLYAATKKSNELMAHAYSHLFNLPTTGLRFFTVYGAWGRPDMALFLFTKAIIEDKPINIFNHGNMQRDFTYIDDIVEGVTRVIDNPPKGNPNWSAMNPDPSTAKSPYKIYNIGNSSPVALMDYIGAIEKALGKEAKKNFMGMQPGDVAKNWADVDDLIADLDYKPKTEVAYGISKFIEWYKAYYKLTEV